MALLATLLSAQSMRAGTVHGTVNNGTTGIPDGPAAAICFNSALSGRAASKFPSSLKNASGGLESFFTPYSSPTRRFAPFG